MKVGVIDVIDWQTVVDLRDGRPVEMAHSRLDLAAALCADHPYPGDLASGGAQWVTDVALDLNVRYNPDFIFLNYAHVYLQSVFRPLSEADRTLLIRAVFEEVQRFVQVSGFEPVIVGLGDLMPLQGYIETTDLDGLVSAAGMHTRCAGLFGPSPRDLAKLSERAGVDRIVSRQAFRTEFGGSERFYAAFPEAIVVTQPGYVLRGVNTSSRVIYQLPRPDDYIPLHTALPGGERLTDVPELVLQGLVDRKVALILVEGVGCDTFPWSFRPLANRLHWYRYTAGSDQYLALTSGRPFTEYPYPPGYRYELHDETTAPYPLSGIFQELPEHTIGRRFAGKSAAVGSRGILTHVVAGTDIAVECFARALYNHGVMAVVEV